MTNSKIFTIFVLDDEPWYGTMIQHYLSMNPDYSVERFEHAHDLLAHLYKKPDVITVDFSMPEVNGQEAMQLIKEQMPDVPIIIISGQEDIQTATALLKDGAFDYILKDSETTKRLWKTLEHIHEIKTLRHQMDQLKNEVIRKYDFANTMLGQSMEMQRVSELAHKAALSNITVSLTGEAGTGKELIAKTIHYNSARSKGAFITVNLAAIPGDYVIHELFGFEKDAFPGAVTRRIGKFEEANNGTIFLDQVNELDYAMQTKLLQVLQEKVINRYGGIKEIPIDVRVIVASTESLKVAVANKTFRDDLYYRLLGLPIHLPALKDRGDDVLVLAKVFVDIFCRQNQLPIKKLSLGAQSVLMRYKFPGNVRELKSLIELAIVLCNNNTIEAHDINLHETKAMKAFIEKEKTLKEYEQEIVQHYLEKYDGNVLQVAEKLAIGKSTLYRMLKNQSLS